MFKCGISFYCSKNCKNIVKAKPFNILFTARMKINLLPPSVTSSLTTPNHGRAGAASFFPSFMAYICTSSDITQITHSMIKVNSSICLTVKNHQPVLDVAFLIESISYLGYVLTHAEGKKTLIRNKIFSFKQKKLKVKFSLNLKVK